MLEARAPVEGLVTNLAVLGWEPFAKLGVGVPTARLPGPVFGFCPWQRASGPTSRPCPMPFLVR
jgi:hypothetical protein